MITHKITLAFLFQLCLLFTLTLARPIRRRDDNVVYTIVATTTIYPGQVNTAATTTATAAALDTATALNLAAVETTTSASGSNFLSELLKIFKDPQGTQYTYTQSASTIATSAPETVTSSPATYSTSATYSSDSPSTVQESATYTTATSIPSGASKDTVNKLWNRFWLSSNSAWNDDDSDCGTGDFNAVVVWDQAVVGRAITNNADVNEIETTIANLNKYENANLNVFSASTAGNDDIYTDDNAQVAWVYLDAYKITGNGDYLTKATDIVNFLMNQTDSKGGVIWKYQGTYIASISTSEAALAAVRLYEVSPNEALITFAQNCMNYMFQYFQDPSDKLFYDGLDMNDYSDLNKGKLSYTVGTSLSTLAYLHKYTGNQYWQTKAIELGKAATNQDGAFYSGDKLWNNQLQYVHLLYAGFADLFTIDSWDSSYSAFKTEVLRQGQYVYNYLQDPDDVHLYFDAVSSATHQMYNAYSKAYSGGSAYSSNPEIYCTGSTIKTKKSLMDNASAAQIVHVLSQIQ